MKETPYGIGVVDLSTPNYKNCSIFGTTKVYEKYEGKICVLEKFKGQMVLIDYVEGAVCVEGVNDE